MNRIISTVFKSGILVLSIALSGCFQNSKTEPTTTEGFSSYDLTWPSKEINVCWLNPAPENELYRQTMTQAMKAEIEAKTIVSFAGFAPCDATQKQEIKIRFANEWPNAGGIGRIGGIVTMATDFSNIKNAKGELGFPSCVGNEITCTYIITTHEIMHALGFYHEQDRVDTPEECVQKIPDYPASRSGGYKTTTNTHLGPFDPDSIMNYCLDTWNNNGKLSTQDIASVNEMYKDALDKPKPIIPQSEVRIGVEVAFQNFKIIAKFTNENEFPVRCNFVKLSYSANIYNRAIGGEYVDTITSDINLGTLTFRSRIRETRTMDATFKDYIGQTGNTHYCGALNWNKGSCQLSAAWLAEGFVCKKEPGF
jgi:hypothetical protein